MIFILVSGEHPTLPKAEVKAILEAENFYFNFFDSPPRVLRIDASTKAGRIVCERAAYTNVACLELVYVKDSSVEEFLKNVKDVSFEGYLSSGESFAVSFKCIDKSLKSSVKTVVSRIGEIISKKFSNVKVNLKKPDKTFLVVSSNSSFLFGLVLSSPLKCFGLRSPRKKPFFHPSALQPKIARCMVNLSRVKVGGLDEYVYDPFCGTGTILIEAGLIGVKKVFGSDVDIRMVKGARLNLKHYGIDGDIFIADALNPPVLSVNHVVTNPPYGRVSKTFGKPSIFLIENFIIKALNLLKKNGTLCLITPSKINVSDVAENLGFKVLEKHFIYVHKSLTREISVLKLL
ncbi:MAG: methyltransferase [Candidatus Bathyarchaeota archaeon]|nr:methyltransferase [Candidatus Bathyarchaeota archaeon]